jgi:serine/threonine protein kinase
MFSSWKSFFGWGDTEKPESKKLEPNSEDEFVSPGSGTGSDEFFDYPDETPVRIRDGSTRYADEEGVVRGKFVPVQVGAKVCGGYEVEKVLGQGSFGRVFKVRDKDGNSLAAKQIINPHFRLGSDIIKELDFLNRLSHPNIMTSTATDFIPEITCILGEVMSGDLSSLLAQRDMESDDDILYLYDMGCRDIWVQLLKGLAYLHNNFVIHNDLKPENILFKGDLNDYAPSSRGFKLKDAGKFKKGVNVKISDYGLSVNTTSLGKVPYISQVITSWWRPPELLAFDIIEFDLDAIQTIPSNRRDFFYGNEVDVYSMGVIGMELLLGVEPFPVNEENPSTLLALAKRGAQLPDILKPSPEYMSEVDMTFYEDHINRLPDDIQKIADKELKILLEMVGVNHDRPSVKQCIVKSKKVYGVMAPKGRKKLIDPEDERVSYPYLEILPENKRARKEIIKKIETHVSAINRRNNRTEQTLIYIEGVAIEAIDVYDRLRTIFSERSGVFLAKIASFIAVSLMVPTTTMELASVFDDEELDDANNAMREMMQAIRGNLFRPTLDHFDKRMTISDTLRFLQNNPSPSGLSEN